MNPDYGEDSAEVIGSSTEEEDEAGDEDETEAPEDRADDQPQLDRASSNEPRPTAAGGDQAETAQPAAPAPDTAVLSLLYLFFIVFEELVNLHNSTRGVYFELGQRPLLCKYLSAFYLSLLIALFGFFPLPPFHSRCFARRTVAPRAAAGQMLGYF